MAGYRPLAERQRAPKPATDATRRAQAQVRASLDFTDQRSFADAQRGFIASIDPLTIMHDAGGRASYDLAQLAFLQGEAPDTVNPSLWRQAQLCALHHGLFEVTDGIYQVRSFDIANMTLVRGETGWLVIDPLTSAESSRAALALANQHLGERPVSAIIHSHSHADHFAGVLGVISAEDAAAGKTPIIAPRDFVQEALAENVLAGNAMNRRATYMYGSLLPPSPTGFVTTGLGAALSMGSTGFALPNDIIKETGETRVLDGVELEFQLTMGTEAPSEMVFYFPQFKALCMAEITSHHLHNVYTPRGAQVRDALAWADQINEAIDRFGQRLELQFACHHWPIWGREAALGYLKKQRDLYKFIHDQALRLANQGCTMDELAEQLALPESLGREFYNRDYYGALHANARAVYVKYLGFFDGNPAHLHPLPPRDAAQRYVRYMGGAAAIVKRAQADFAKGDYRWVAEALNHVVMADPEQQAARALLADALEQLGYQAEAAPWRNFYLSGALELREGLPAGSAWSTSAGMVAAIPLESLFQLLAVRLNAGRAEGLRLNINLAFTDREPALITVENSVLHGFLGKQHPAPDATLKCTEQAFKRLMVARDASALAEEGALAIEGDPSALPRLAALLDSFPRRFPLVTPRT